MAKTHALLSHVILKLDAWIRRNEQVAKAWEPLGRVNELPVSANWKQASGQLRQIIPVEVVGGSEAKLNNLIIRTAVRVKALCLACLGCAPNSFQLAHGLFATSASFASRVQELFVCSRGSSCGRTSLDPPAFSNERPAPNMTPSCFSCIFTCCLSSAPRMFKSGSAFATTFPVLRSSSVLGACAAQDPKPRRCFQEWPCFQHDSV